MFIIVSVSSNYLPSVLTNVYVSYLSNFRTLGGDQLVQRPEKNSSRTRGHQRLSSTYQPDIMFPDCWSGTTSKRAHSGWTRLELQAGNHFRL
eukprot:6899639-Heterocapsa_arctica.AAC.1